MRSISFSSNEPVIVSISKNNYKKKRNKMIIIFAWFSELHLESLTSTLEVMAENERVHSLYRGHNLYKRLLIHGWIAWFAHS